MTIARYNRIRELQALCWARGRKAWARALGQALREMRQDDPDLFALAN